MDHREEFIVVCKENVIRGVEIFVHLSYPLLVGSMVDVLAWFDPLARVDLVVFGFGSSNMIAVLDDTSKAHRPETVTSSHFPPCLTVTSSRRS